MAQLTITEHSQLRSLSISSEVRFDHHLSNDEYFLCMSQCNEQAFVLVQTPIDPASLEQCVNVDDSEQFSYAALRTKSPDRTLFLSFETVDHFRTACQFLGIEVDETICEKVELAQS